MSAVVVAHAFGDDLDAGASHTVAFNCGAVGSDGALYIAVRRDGGTEDISAVAYNAVSATYIGESAGFELWRLLAPTASTSLNVTWTVGGSGGRCNHAFISLSGVDQTTPEGTLQTVNSSASGNRSVGPVTCPADGLVLGWFIDEYSDSDASGTGMLGQFRGAGRVIAGTSLSATGSPTWIDSNYATAWQALGLPINAAGGGGPPGVTPPVHRRAFNLAILNH